MGFFDNTNGDAETMWNHIQKLFPDSELNGIPSLEVEEENVANTIETLCTSWIRLVEKYESELIFLSCYPLRSK